MDLPPSNLLAGGAATLSLLILLQPSLAVLFFDDRYHRCARSEPHQFPNLRTLPHWRCLNAVFGRGVWSERRERVFSDSVVTLFPLSFHTSSDERIVDWFCMVAFSVCF
ncbi:hypothetical protein AAZX31_13G140000 [Glycine max]|uniref:Secreted protein n=2 Tax=Glycine subgen. Soja TaxID=1462606 RepID=K7M009_SOYBN|nr:hypothetical protein JHK87_036315 [Glycine soja]KAG5130408.1 hypothetical protein JHK84_036805 [Glycine max]KAH1101719.1 hypothetical protein GYH30_036338 [Glycine max]KHN22088.1 hypothetical protein glysoja_033402 [Glycine soja]KRH20082.1 hypothetical protein GLYMA_13G155000v4 [Glycine max]